LPAQGNKQGCSQVLLTDKVAAQPLLSVIVKVAGKPLAMAGLVKGAAIASPSKK